MCRSAILASLIALIGAGVNSAFLALHISGANEGEDLLFEEHATELISTVKDRWDDYEVAALWVHEACRSNPEHNSSLKICSREYFHDLNEYLREGGLDVEAVSFIPTVAHENRHALEAESREYYRDNYPGVNYYGITGYELIGPDEYDFHWSAEISATLLLPWSLRGTR
jgi:hypothetical protein